MSSTVKGVLVVVAFVLCLVLVVVGQRGEGWPALGVMLLGVAGLLGLLFAYNRRYR